MKSAILILFALPCALFGQTTGPTYRFVTNLGNIDVQLTPAAAPMTVANFINYVNSGAYVNTIIHRSVPGFVIQGGGFQFQGGAIVTTPTNAPVVNEFNVSNTTGTISMAKLGTDPNSATSQWFFNLADNGTNGNTLDSSDGGYTVFGTIVNSTPTTGLAVMNRIALLPVDDCSGDGGACSLPTTDYNSAFTNLPLSTNNLVLIASIVPVPQLTAPGFESGASFASSSLTGISPGEIIVIYGQGMGPSQLTTLTVNNGAAATTLAGTQVLFNNKPAPIIYTSATQVSVVAPYEFAGLPSVDVVVTYNGTASTTLVFPVKPANPAVFTLNSSGTGDAAIIRPDGSIVSAASPASPGDVIVLYGEGYGVPTSGTAVPDGTIIGATLPVPADPTTLLLIDGQPVTTQYFGGAPSLINGVLQVNFAVPQLAPGSHQIQLSVAGRLSPTGVTLHTK